MKLVAYDTGANIMIGALTPDGAVEPIAPRDTFWRDPYTHIAASRREPALQMSAIRQTPAVPASARVICIGLNYRNHALEGGRGEDAIPKIPVVFGRWTASLVSDGDPCPVMEERYDWEGELAAIIGRPMFKVDAAQGLTGVFGYCAFNDLSARTVQRHTPQWTLGKNAERSGPMSAITTADEVGDPAQGLRLTTTVNDVIMQDDNTRDLIFPVGTLIEYLSKVLTLNPGDVIVTGTPAGIGAARTPPIFLKPGDRVTVEIEKVGKVSNRMVAPPASVS